MGKSDSRHPETLRNFQRPGDQAGSFQEILESYLHAIRATLRSSSIAVYRSRVKQFIRYLESHHPSLGLHELDRPVIEGWLHHLAEQAPALGYKTRRESIITVRSFLNRMQERDDIHLEPDPLILKSDLPRKKVNTLEGISEELGNFKVVLDSFLEAIGTTLRPGTVFQYKSKLRHFVRYLRSEHPALRSFHELDRTAIEGWLRHLAERVPPLLNGTRRDAIIAVRSFLDRICEWGWVNEPLQGLVLRTDFPPKDRRLPRPLPQEVDEALRAELRATGDLLSMALLLQRATGMRMGELCHLELEALEEVAGNRWQIRVPLGKLHTERVVPVDQETAGLFRKIREARGDRPPLPHPETGKPTHFLLLWPGNRKHHFRKKLQRALACAVKGAGLACRVTSHRFRHTYATELLRSGIGLPALAKILGHRSIEMTLQYAHLVQEDVWRQYEAACESIKSRYVFPPSSPGLLGKRGDRADVHDLLKALIARLEGLRRDKQVRDFSKVIRVLERLRRMAGHLREVVR